MRLSDLYFWKHSPEPPSEPETPLGSCEPEVPESATVILEEIKHAEISGHPDMVFKSHERVYMGEDGRKCKITIQTNLQATGCGHNISSPADVGFISYQSNLPVCKTCEQEYYRLHEQTRHENGICRHLVAPHELAYLEGKGFVCDECKKREKTLSPKKIGKWFWGSILKPIVTVPPEQPGGDL